MKSTSVPTEYAAFVATLSLSPLVLGQKRVPSPAPPTRRVHAPHIVDLIRRTP